MNNVKISVIIPTCHRNDLLALCLDCLAPGVQTLAPERYEVIVTDDGSRSTAQQMMAQSYPWAQWTEGPRRGPAANRNHGATIAQGEWLAFTDDDCLPKPGWLEAFQAAIQPDVSVYEGKTTCEAGLPSPLYEAPYNLTGGNLWSCNFMIRAALFARLEGFDETFATPAMEDIDFRERLYDIQTKVVFIKGAVIDHPARLKPSGRQLGKKYETFVQFWCKRGHRGSLFLQFLRHTKNRIAVDKVFSVRNLGEAWLISYSLLTEFCYIAARLSIWKKRYEGFYTPKKMPHMCNKCQEDSK